MQTYIENAEAFRGDEGIFDVVKSVGITTIFTAAASL
jgi:sterol 14-demethylase